MPTEAPAFYRPTPAPGGPSASDCARPRMNRPFSKLTPMRCWMPARAFGIETDGRLFALNSYENRVYQVGSTSHGTLVLKFYRPNRWSDAQIREEHEFALELASAAELPVAAPLRVGGDTLLFHDEYRLGVFPKRAGRIAEFDAPGALALVGRTLGRIHARGALQPFATRPRLTVARLGHASRDAVLAAGLLDVDMERRYAEVAEDLLQAIETEFETTGPLAMIRIHGDCHVGNILWDEHGPVFVDLDDCMMGPRVQDLWMPCRARSTSVVASGRNSPAATLPSRRSMPPNCG
ncbi:MAG: serine/threonine protein kinase [Steroidobacteraceae bacterium]